MMTIDARREQIEERLRTLFEADIECKVEAHLEETRDDLAERFEQHLRETFEMELDDLVDAALEREVEAADREGEESKHVAG